MKKKNELNRQKKRKWYFRLLKKIMKPRYKKPEFIHLGYLQLSFSCFYFTRLGSVRQPWKTALANFVDLRQNIDILCRFSRDIRHFDERLFLFFLAKPRLILSCRSFIRTLRGCRRCTWDGFWHTARWLHRSASAPSAPGQPQPSGAYR